MLHYIKCQIPVSLDPLRFTYRKNRSVEDAISLALNSVYEHLDEGKVYLNSFYR